jgi:hypothetical protein
MRRGVLVGVALCMLACTDSLASKREPPALPSDGSASRDASGSFESEASALDEPHDAGKLDRSVRDAEPGRDASEQDAAMEAAAPVPCRPFAPPPSCSDLSDLPERLECTGLYADMQRRELACGVRAYTPAYALWSDGLDKRRWVLLPPGETIDANDPDEWLFPVGTRFWKEFSRPGSDGREPLETRFLYKSERGWLYTTYVWSADRQTVIRQDDGIQNLMGSGHTVPSHEQCAECHRGRRDMVLGWDAFLLGAGAEGVTRTELVRAGLVRGAQRIALEVPGDEVERAALGYLHVNCGVSCHNQQQYERGEVSPLLLRLESDEAASVHTTAAVRTGINRRPTPAALLFMSSVPAPPGPYYDLRPLDPARSLLLARMSLRGFLRQMPRLGTNVVDERGAADVRRWIEHMTPERGYGAAAP